jgi:uncharacterized membrane protein YvlD (DUF360 family)
MGRPVSSGFNRSDVVRGAVALLVTSVGLALAGWILPGIAFDGWWPVVLVALAMAAVGLVIRPLLVAIATPFGMLGALVLALLGQAVLAYVALSVVPGVQVDSFLAAFWATWVVAGVATLASWVMTAGTNDAVFAHLVRGARRGKPVPDPDVTGILFVQLDGVPFPVLQWGVMGGTLPTLSRWIRGGSHEFMEWTPTLPATTPASQMGILHGTTDGIPAFRWVDRATGRVFVANKPADAVDIEAMHSDGRGLLADGGVSVSNLFSGDAPKTFATMSRVGALRGDRDGRRRFNRFLMRPDGFMRGVIRTTSELVRERTQARRQIRQDMRPRVHRGWDFAAERGALNGVMRDFNTVMVGEALASGARSIYVDYVDYDAVAHHAGIMRPESLDALVGLDALLGQLEKVASVAKRDYRIVVLSDHGQSQGEVFADRFGESLSDLVSRLAGTTVAGTEVNTEGSARVDVLTEEQPPLVAQALRAGSSGTMERAQAEESAAQEVATSSAAAGASSAERTVPDQSLLVFGSGNLGLVYASGEGHRLTRTEIEARWPALLPGLTRHEGVSFVVVDTADGPVAIGRSGEHRLRDGVVTGTDPLTAFRPEAASFLLRASSMPEAPDIAVNSVLAPVTGEVAAFEGLVGCHGGLGGWQDRAMLVWPSDLPRPPERLIGADAVHRQLVTWLEHLGHRTDLPPARHRPYESHRSPAP